MHNSGRANNQQHEHTDTASKETNLKKWWFNIHHHFTFEKQKSAVFLSYSVSYYSIDDVSMQADILGWDLYTEGWVTDIAKRGNLQPVYMELIV